MSILKTFGVHPDREESASKQERAYQLLKAMIKDGRIHPGEKLLEVQVSKAFGVSRSPARHALEALCAEKLLRPAPGRGYVVSGRRVAGTEPALATVEEIKLAPSPRWENVYQEVEQEVCMRVLFGSVRIKEERLAEHFGVSRTVARYVLARLQGLGLLSQDRLGHWMAEQVTPARIRDLYEVRWLLEPQALVQSAPHISPESLAQAKKSLSSVLSGSLMENSELIRVENDIHVDLLSHCMNKEILHALDRTQILFVPVRYMANPFLGIPIDLVEDALKEHLQIIKYLQRKDVASAAEALSIHVKKSCGRWMRRFEKISLTSDIKMPPYLSIIAGAPATKAPCTSRTFKPIAFPDTVFNTQKRQ